MPPFAFASVCVWAAATLGHFLLTARWCRRLEPVDGSWDERAATVVLAGVGSLTLVLHVVSIATGLTLAAGLAGLGIWHGLVAVFLPAQAAAPSAAARPASPTGQRVVESVALVCGVAVLVHWVEFASRSLDVLGTDATNYHFPFAVNFSLGASPFSLPATTALYPMGGSVLAAWFILPLHDALLVDLTMALWWVLLAVSLNHLFRLATGESGLAWSSWLVFALFSTPMLRYATFLSADLVFATGTVALLTALAAVWHRGRWRPIDVVLVGLATGLLLGSKTTGAPMSFLLLAIFGGAWLLRCLASRTWPRVSRRAIGAALAASLLAIGAGGVWLISSWYLYGGPLETGLRVFGIQVLPGSPWQPTLDRSVLHDLRTDPSYALFDRAMYFIRDRFGGSFPVFLPLGLLVVVDAVVARWRRVDSARWTTRALVAACVVLSGAPLVWMVLGVPGSSLEETQGFSLRYVLPLAVLLPGLGFIGLFPASWPWYRRSSVALPIMAALAVAGLWMFVTHSLPTARHFAPLPALSAGSLGIAASIVGVLAWARRSRSSLRRFVPAAAALVCALSTALVVTSRDVKARSAAEQAEATERAEFAANPQRAASPARALYLSVVDDEGHAGRPCGRRRFFEITRFDEPTSLEFTTLTNEVFYASRDVGLARRQPPLGPCDYVITSRGVMDTDKGAALASALAGGAALREVAAVQPWVVLGLR